MRTLSLKGTKDSEWAQHNFELKRDVAWNREALKLTNSRLLQVERLQEVIYSVLRKGSESGKLVSLEAVVKIAFNVNKLTAAWSEMCDVMDPLRLVEGQKKRGDYVR